MTYTCAIEVIIIIQDTLKRAFEENNGILTTEMALGYGIHDSTLRRAVERKNIQRYCKGIYFLNNLYFDDLYFVQLKHSKGVYSHDTAIMLHELTTFSPFVYHVTFPQGYHVSNAKEQLIEMHYADNSELSEEYIQTIYSWESNPIKVTNLEKTIVDTFRYEKLMTFLVQEMIGNYVDREDQDVQKLIEYADRYGVLDVIEREVMPFVKPTTNEKL